MRKLEGKVAYNLEDLSNFTKYSIQISRNQTEHEYNADSLTKRKKRRDAQLLIPEGAHTNFQGKRQVRHNMPRQQNRHACHILHH